MNLKKLDDRFVPGLAHAVQRRTDRLVGRLPKSWQRRLADPPAPPRRPVRRATGPAPVIVRLREVDDRYARTGPLGLVREVPQVGVLVLALLVALNGALFVDRERDRSRLEQEQQQQEQPGSDDPAAPDVDDLDGRIGPDLGDDVAAYLAASEAELARRAKDDNANVPVWSVVSFDRYLNLDQLVAITEGIRPQFVVLRVPPVSKDVLSESQTVGVRNLATDLPRVIGNVAAEKTAEAERLEKQAATIENDPAQKAFDLATARQLRAEATILRRGCACVYGVQVKATPAELLEVAMRDGVRSVDVGPVSRAFKDVTFHVLLPEDRVTVTGGNEGVPGG